MKKNAYLLVLVSLILGALIAMGTSRLNPYGKLDNCIFVSPTGTKSTFEPATSSVKLCGAEQLGYPYKYLHSQVFVTESSNSWTFMTAKPWVEFKVATADWMIWSVLSAVGLGLLIYLLERAGAQTGFVERRSSKRRR